MINTLCIHYRVSKLTVNDDVILDDKDDAVAIGWRSSAAGQQTGGVKQTTPGHVDTVNRNDSITCSNRSITKRNVASFTHNVLLLPNSLNWYRLDGGDALRLGR